MTRSQLESLGLSSSLSNRLPTVSAAQALLSSSANRAISTGLERLDEALSQNVIPGQDQPSKGISRGHVTEVFGPPGAGKTTFAMTVAANALKNGGQVTWIDTGPPIVGPRLNDILSKQTPVSAEGDASSPSAGDKLPDELLNSFLHLRASSIPHLLSLLLHPPPGFLVESTTLLVIDSMSMLFNSAYPPTATQPTKTPNGAQRESWKERRPWQSNRKWSVAEDIITKLAGLAASRNIAVLLTSHATTTAQNGARLTLRPAMSGTVWDPCVHFRIALYHSWLPVGTAEASEMKTRLRVTGFAEVLKTTGNTSACGTSADPVPFTIEESGLKGVTKSATAAKYTGPGALHSRRKRKFDMVTENDYEGQGDDEYGWTEHDDALIDTLARPYDEEQDLI